MMGEKRGGKERTETRGKTPPIAHHICDCPLLHALLVAGPQDRHDDEVGSGQHITKKRKNLLLQAALLPKTSEEIQKKCGGGRKKFLFKTSSIPYGFEEKSM